MQSWGARALSLVLALAVAQGARPGPAPADVWEAAYLHGAHIGYVHARFQVSDDPAGKHVRSTEEILFSLRHRNALLQSRMEHGTEEEADGRVSGVFMKQYQGGRARLTLTGTVENGKLHYLVQPNQIDQRVAWHEQVIGLWGQEQLFRSRHMGPGDEFSFFAFEPTFARMVTRRARAIGMEEVATAQGRQRLLRVEVATDRLPGLEIPVPKRVLWLDGEGVALRRQLSFDDLGIVELVRTTRAAATEPAGAATAAPDIGLTSLVPLDRAVARARSRPSATYRITVRGDSDAASAFVQDAHQEIRQARGDTFELTVHPLRSPTGRGDARPGPEYLASSYYIDCADPVIWDLARQATDGEIDPWRAALRIERWVHGNLRPDNAAPLVPASQIGRTMRGDCRHYALLTTALCRVEAIPARTAVGLLQVERDGRAYLGFHLWTEVCVDGHWRGLDATLGWGGVGAGHLKVAEHSWHDTRSLTPFLPVQRLLGKMTATVVD